MNKNLMRSLLGLILLSAVATAITQREQFDAAALQAWVEGAGAAGPVLFMLVYALAAVLFLPGSVLTLAGGALFGPLWGTLWNLTGATLGAALAFLIARYLGADWVKRRAGARLTRLNDGVSAEGWRFVAFTRLVPVFPFNLLNYALEIHAARRHRLYLARPCRTRSPERRRRHDSQHPDRTGAACRRRLPAASGAQTAGKTDVAGDVAD
jgi:uncharacterized membrane protein YdjX (TVP38/TMEM64 family)